jgi:hypothetical protein
MYVYIYIYTYEGNFVWDDTTHENNITIFRCKKIYMHIYLYIHIYVYVIIYFSIGIFGSRTVTNTKDTCLIKALPPS